MSVAARGALAPELRGILGILAAMLLFTLMDSCAKYLMERNPPLVVIWARFAGQSVLVALVFLPSLGRRIRTARPGLQFARSSLHLLATGSFFTALSFMPLAEAVVVFEVAPLLITCFAALILREAVGPRRWAAVVAGLLGALIIIQPGAGVFQPVALLPLLAATCMALFQILTRLIGGADSIWTTMIWSGLVGTVATSLAVPFVWVTPSAADALLLAAFGWLGYLGHLALVYALAQAPASVLAPFNYAGFIWALIVGLIAFGEVPGPSTLVGASVIVGAGLYVWHRERVRHVRLPAATPADPPA